MSLRGSEQNLCDPKHMKIALLRRGSIRRVMMIMWASLIPMHQAMKIPNSKAAFDKSSDKPEKLPAWQVEEVKSLKEVIERHKKEGNTVHPRGPVALRGDLVQDDPGSYAVFNERGRSASQMTSTISMRRTSK